MPQTFKRKVDIDETNLFLSEPISLHCSCEAGAMARTKEEWFYTSGEYVNLEFYCERCGRYFNTSATIKKTKITLEIDLEKVYEMHSYSVGKLS